MQCIACVIFTSGVAHPLFIVCVHGFGPQVVQETISFGTADDSRFLSPCGINRIEKYLIYLDDILKNFITTKQSVFMQAIIFSNKKQSFIYCIKHTEKYSLNTRLFLELTFLSIFSLNLVWNSYCIDS